MTLIQMADRLAPTMDGELARIRVAACLAFGIDFLEVVDPIPISAVYGMPEMARVGLTEEQCQEQGLDYAVGAAHLPASRGGPSLAMMGC